MFEGNGARLRHRLVDSTREEDFSRDQTFQTKKFDNWCDTDRTCMKLPLYEIALSLDSGILLRHGFRNRLKCHLLQSNRHGFRNRLKCHSLQSIILSLSLIIVSKCHRLSLSLITVNGITLIGEP